MPEDGTDVFLHGSVFARAGLSVNQGDAIRVGVGQGLKGRQVTEVLEAKVATKSAGPSDTAGRQRARHGEVVERAKGFGFVAPGTGT